MSTASRIAKNSLYQIIGKVVTLGLSLVMVAVLARKLGISSYGEYTTAMTFSQLFAIIADLGIGIFILKRLSAAGARVGGEGKILGTVIEVRLVTAILSSLLAIGVAFLLPYNHTTRGAIAIALVASVIQMVNYLYISVLQSQLEMRYSAVSEAIGRAVMLIGSLIALYLNWGVPGVIAAQVVGNLVNLGITYVASRRFVKPQFSFAIKEWKRVLSASVIIGVSSMLSYIYFKTDILLLSVLPMPGRENTTEVGLYGTAYKVVEILILLPGIFMGSVFPILTETLARKAERDSHSLVERAFQVLLAIGLAAAVGLLLFAPIIVKVIAGSAFTPSAEPLQVLALAVPLNFLGTVFTFTLIALEKERILSVLYGVAAVVNVTANLIFIPNYSYHAAAWITVITELIVLCGGWYLVSKRFSVTLFSRESRYILGMIALGGTVTYLIPDELAALRLLLFSAVLGLTAFKLRTKLLLRVT